MSEVEGELRRLAGRLEGARGPGAEGLGPQLQPFLRAAEEELRGVREALEQMHHAAAATLDFFCEDAVPGGLPELCAVLHGFAGRLLAAAQVSPLRAPPLRVGLEPALPPSTRPALTRLCPAGEPGAGAGAAPAAGAGAGAAEAPLSHHVLRVGRGPRGRGAGRPLPAHAPAQPARPPLPASQL